MQSPLYMATNPCDRVGHSCLPIYLLPTVIAERTPGQCARPATERSNLPVFAKGSAGDSTRLLAAFWKRHFRTVFNAYPRHMGCGGGGGVDLDSRWLSTTSHPLITIPLSAVLWLSAANSTSVEWQIWSCAKAGKKATSSLGQEISSVACVQSPRRYHRVPTINDSITIGARTDFILSNSRAGDLRSRTERHQEGPTAYIHLGTQHQYHQRAAPRIRLPLKLSDETEDKRAIRPRARLPRHR